MYLQTVKEPDVRANLTKRVFSNATTPSSSSRVRLSTMDVSSTCKLEMPQNKEWDALLEEKDEVDILFNEENLIKGGTVECIVRTITNPKFSSPSCLNAFLLTYRAFTTPLELLRLLIARFHVKSSRNQDPEFKKYFEERKRKPIQLRFVDFISIPSFRLFTS